MRQQQQQQAAEERDRDGEGEGSCKAPLRMWVGLDTQEVAGTEHLLEQAWHLAKSICSGAPVQEQERQQLEQVGFGVGLLLQQLARGSLL